MIEQEPVSEQAFREFRDAFVDGEVAGLAEYGVHLTTWNGRSAFRDAMGELADASKYLTQLEAERNDLAAALREYGRHLPTCESARGCSCGFLTATTKLR